MRARQSWASSDLFGTRFGHCFLGAKMRYSRPALSLRQNTPSPLYFSRAGSSDRTSSTSLAFLAAAESLGRTRYLRVSSILRKASARLDVIATAVSDAASGAAGAEPTAKGA